MTKVNRTEEMWKAESGELNQLYIGFSRVRRRKGKGDSRQRCLVMIPAFVQLLEGVVKLIRGVP